MGEKGKGGGGFQSYGGREMFLLSNHSPYISPFLLFVVPLSLTASCVLLYLFLLHPSLFLLPPTRPNILPGSSLLRCFLRPYCSRGCQCLMRAPDRIKARGTGRGTDGGAVALQRSQPLHRMIHGCWTTRHPRHRGPGDLRHGAVTRPSPPGHRSSQSSK